MANKPEIYLEIGTGFFRIPTSEANYNISVLDTLETSVTRVVEKIVEQESPPAEVAENAMSAVSAGLSEGDSDGFYRDVSKDLYNDIGTLAKSLSATMMDIPAEDRRGKRVELDEAGHKIEDAKSQLKDIVEMTEKAAMKIMDKVEDVQGCSNDVQDLLSNLKNHAAFAVSGESSDEGEEVTGEDKPCAAKIETEALRDQMRQAMDLLTALEEEPAQPEVQEEAAPPAPEVKIEKKTRFLFDLDVVFQTLYELCTNETVKDHITSARERREEIFDINAFYEVISPKAAKYEADSDNFFTVPMSDVFASLHVACSDKGISNLLKKMDSGQSSIFLDQTIPLEVPPTDEIEVEVETAPPPTPEPPAALASVEPDPRIAEVKELLAAAMARGENLSGIIDEGAESSYAGCAMTVEDQQDVFKKIEDAFGIATTISGDVAKITEALSFQDLSGQQIMKIIKLLSDFQVQLLALVVSFGSQLKHKEENADISVEDSKKLAQDDVDSYINKIAGGSAEGDDGGMLDQQTVNSMLEEMGF